MKYLKVKIIIAKTLELIFSLGTLFLIFIKYDFSIILVFYLCSIALIITYDTLLIKKLEKKKLDYEEDDIYIVNRVPNLNIELIYNLVFCVIILITNFPPFVDMIWVLISWSIIRYLSKRVNITSKRGFFLTLKEDRIVKYLDNESYYEYSELIAIKVKDDRILINTGFIPLPVYLEIKSDEKERMKAFFEKNAKSIHAKY